MRMDWGAAMGQYDSFVLRVWRRAASKGAWVGQLEHLQERDSHTFHDVDLLLAHLRATIAPAGKQGEADPMMALSWAAHTKPNQAAVKQSAKDLEAAGGAGGAADPPVDEGVAISAAPPEPSGS